MEVVAVIGLGYVGLPLAVSFAEAGLRVIGVDTDGEKITALKAGDSYIEDVSAERVWTSISSGELAR